jgi:hypothetical protein
MEKAAAKYYGTYENMNDGMMDEAIYALTGVPSFHIYHGTSSSNAFWEMLTDWDSKNYIMTAGNYKSDYGLSAGHAYTIIGTAMYQGKGLVKLRNPWG